MMRQGWGLLGAILLARIAFGYQLQTVASLGPLLVQAFGIDFSRLGTLIGLYLLPGVFAALPCGFLARRFGDRAVLTGGMALMAAGSILSAAAAGPAGIGLGRAIAGAGAVGLTVLQGKVVADRFTGARFTIAMGLAVGAFPVGIGLGQLTHVPLADAAGWPAAFLTGAALAAIACLLTGITFGSAATRSAGAMLHWPSRRERFLVVVAGLIWTAYNAGYQNFLAYLPSDLAAHGHSRQVADVVITIATWANFPSVLLGSAMAVRFGARPVFLVGTVLGVVSIGGLGLADWPLLWGTLFGTLGSVHGAIIVALGTQSTRPDNRAVGMSLFYTTYYLGGALIPVLCGRAADLAGDPSGAFLCAAALSALAIPFYLLHRSRADTQDGLAKPDRNDIVTT